MSRYKFDHLNDKMTKLYKGIAMAGAQVPEKVRSWLGGTKGIITVERVATEFGSNLVTASNYLSRLEQEGALTRIAHGEYVLFQAGSMQPVLTEETIQIHRCIKDTVPHLSFVIWSLSSFGKLFHDVPVSHYTFIEAASHAELVTIKERLFERDREAVIEPGMKEYADFTYKKVLPVILLRRSNRYGCIFVDGVETATVERSIIDMYFEMTRHEIPFAAEEFKHVLTNVITSRGFNFSFASRYARMRNVDFEFDMIFSTLAKDHPDLVPVKPTRRIKVLDQVMTGLFGDGWMHRVIE